MLKTSGDGTHIVYRFLTPRNLLCLMAGYGIFAGWKFQNPQLISVGIFALAIVLSGVWFAYIFKPSVRVKRRHTGRAFEQQVVPVELHLQNESGYSPSLVLIEDYFPPASHTRFRHLVLQPFSNKNIVRMKYLANCNNRRGLYTNGPIRIEAFDNLGLFRRRVLIDEFTEILLYPNTAALEYFSVLGDGTLRHVGLETVLRSGESAEFTGLRPWQDGDSPSKIHWRTSARDNEFRVKEFQESIVTDLTIFVDTGKLGLRGLGEQTSIEYSIKAAASVARTAIEKGHLVQVILIGGEIEHIPLGSGQKHLLMILDRLSFVKPDKESNFRQNLLNQIPWLRRGGTAVMIQSITTIELNGISEVVGALEARQILPVLVGVDDRQFIKLYREQEDIQVAAASVEETIQRLVLQGIRVHILRKHKQPLEGLRQGLDKEEHFSDSEEDRERFYEQETESGKGGMFL